MQQQPSVVAIVHGLETCEHGLSLDAWAAFLLQSARREYEEPPPPATPCFAEPGTLAKVQAMEERAAADRQVKDRRGLYHPDDLTVLTVDHAARPAFRIRNGVAKAGQTVDRTPRAPDK